jgi:hypothetical protein
MGQWSASHLEIVADWKIERAGSSIGKRWRSIFVDSVHIILHIFGISRPMARKHGAVVHIHNTMSSPQGVLPKLSAPMGYNGSKYSKSSG